MTTNTELIATIRNEIERRITDNTFGAKLELIDILAWLDTLESEKPMNQNEDLNEEIKKFIDEYGYERGADKLLIAIVARNFVEWQKEQMMEDAVEGKIIFLLNGDVAVNIGDTDEYKLGQKVRIIIVKED
jgi:type I restriction-modification system DNA methylase subunit